MSAMEIRTMLGTFVWSWSVLHYKAFLYHKALDQVFTSIIKDEGTETQLVYTGLVPCILLL